MFWLPRKLVPKNGQSSGSGSVEFHVPPVRRPLITVPLSMVTVTPKSKKKLFLIILTSPVVNTLMHSYLFLELKFKNSQTACGWIKKETMNCLETKSPGSQVSLSLSQDLSVHCRFSWNDLPVQVH